MKSLFKKGWFQVIVFGILIGIILIVLDNKFDLLNEKKEKGNLEGPIQMKKEEVYFTSVNFPEQTFDFGKVKEGDTVSHIIKIQNTGKEPLYIYKANGSCDCVRGRFNPDPVQPGKETEAIIEFKTKGRKGKQIRKVIFTTNTDPSETTFTLTGEVE